MSLGLRGKLQTVFWETDFGNREHTYEMIELIGATGIAVYMMVPTWACHESDDLCIHAHHVSGIARRLKITPSEVEKALHALCSPGVGLLRFEPTRGVWFSKRLFEEAAKLMKRYSRGAKAVEILEYLETLLRGSAASPGITRNEPGSPGAVLISFDSISDLDLKKNGALKIPSAYDTPQIRKWFEAWHQQLKTLGRGLNEIQIEAICSQYPDKSQLESDLQNTCGQTKPSRVICRMAPQANARGSPAAHNKSVSKVLELMSKPT